ncbi:MAG: glycosyltransferase, partial [Halodesulfovibrio sp.]
LAQDYPVDLFEILVVDGGSSDRTREVVGQYSNRHSNVRLLDNPGRRSSSGRNVGFRHGRGDYFVVIDGHCHVPTRGLFRNIADAVAKTGAKCLGWPQTLDAPGISLFQQAVAAVRGSRLGHGGGSLIYSEYEGFASPVSKGAAYSRDVFATGGSVDDAFDACEDVEFNLRVEQAGIQAYNSPGFKVQYYPRESLKGLFRQMHRYGTGRCRLWRKHPQTLTLNTLIPPVFAFGVLLILAVLLAGFILPVPASIQWLCAAPLVAYFALMSMESYKISGGSLQDLQCHLAIFFVIHFGLGFGFLEELVRELGKNRFRTQSAAKAE